MAKQNITAFDPDDMVLIYGADAVRIFALFAAPAENELVWQETGIDGAVRFCSDLSLRLSLARSVAKCARFRTACVSGRVKRKRFKC